MLFSCSAHKETPIAKAITPAKTKTVDLRYSNQKSKLADQRKIISQHAINSLGTQYRWGGQSPKTGFDCSGLIVYTHKKANIIIPRTAKSQFDNGRVVAKNELQVADLVFFKNPKANKVLHVGIYIGDGIFIHAPGKNRQITFGYMNNPYFKKNYLGSRTYL